MTIDYVRLTQSTRLNQKVNRIRINESLLKIQQITSETICLQFDKKKK